MRFLNLVSEIGIGIGAESSIWLNGEHTIIQHTGYKYQKDHYFPEYGICRLSIRDSLKKYLIARLKFGIEYKTLRSLFGQHINELHQILRFIDKFLIYSNGIINLKPDYPRQLEFSTGDETIDFFLFTYENLYSESMRKKLVSLLAREHSKVI